MTSSVVAVIPLFRQRNVNGNALSLKHTYSTCEHHNILLVLSGKPQRTVPLRMAELKTATSSLYCKRTGEIDAEFVTGITVTTVPMPTNHNSSDDARKPHCGTL